MDGGTAANPPPGRRRLRRALRLTLVLALVAVLVVVGLGVFLQLRLSGNLHHVAGAFSGLKDRPSRSADAGDAVNILVVTTDARSSPVTEDGVAAPSWAPNAHHADSVLLLHLDDDRRAASVVSVPLDTSVASGTLADLLPGASPSRLVGELERLTQVRIDHLGVFDWAGFARLTDLAGGVEVPDPAGADGARRRVSGSQGEEYVGGALGDGPGPTKREQYLLRALMDASLHQELRKQPLTLFHLLDTVTRHLAVEKGWSTSSQRSLVIALRNMRSYSIQYVTAAPDGPSPWRAVAGDQVASWVEAHPDAALPFATG